ncbi:MAG: hypothetical protein KC482_11265 [Dehalococcoidia bacterium]|nr:hypothetical protein [Dehalococcoidia bacterium]MCA9826034.1 hypothetical protein [Dehalococcoidia bacterium]MCA9843169.1 hypothetical protein [Dehalococcoidia bacterium]MCA9854154.1 hypothetical protein [Dehalococcoidia bacterium]
MTGELSTSERAFDGIVEVRISLDVDGERVPGVLFMAEGLDEPSPLVFIQHPATSSKDDFFVRDPSMLWCRRGWICAGFDAPYHGDRDDHDPMSVFQGERREQVVAQFGRELSCLADALIDAYPVDPGRLGYVGYSMGSMLGVPAVARDGRFKAAAFCLVGEGGMVGPADGDESVIPLLERVAVRIVGKESDELIPKARTESLYNALPGEKDIVWLPGGHYTIGPDVIDAAGSWMAAKLG